MRRAKRAEDLGEELVASAHQGIEEPGVGLRVRTEPAGCHLDRAFQHHR